MGILLVTTGLGSFLAVSSSAKPPRASTEHIYSPRRMRSPSWSWMLVESLGTSSIHHVGIAGATSIAKVLGWQVTQIKGRTAMFGEVESVQLQIAQIMRPIVSWRMNKGEDMLSELRFKNGGLVQVTKHYDNIERKRWDLRILSYFSWFGMQSWKSMLVTRACFWYRIRIVSWEWGFILQGQSI